MRKTALGIVLALVLAAVPVALFSTAAVAADTADLSIINAQVTSQSTIDVYANGIEVVKALPIATASAVTLPAGSTDITVCKSESAGVTGAGVCVSAPSPAQPTANIGPNITNFDLVGGDNYVLSIPGVAAGPPPGYIGSGAPDIFQNDLSPTGLGEFRFTLHNAAPFVGSLDVCIGGVKVVDGSIDDSTYQETVQKDVTAQQGAAFAVFPSAVGCASPQANVNFVAGTNFVQTAVASNPHSPAGTQVLLVGEGTVPNSPDTVAFCKAIIGLAGVQPALKTLIGNVDPTSKDTIINTQPSVGDMKAFVTTTQDALDAGDSTVPAAIADSWATATAGLRKLLQTFQLSGYNLANLPVSAVEALVEGANGFKLPGVPPDEDVVAATDALTAFYTSTCSAAPGPTPAAPPAAAPVQAAARFTG